MYLTSCTLLSYVSSTSLLIYLIKSKPTKRWTKSRMDHTLLSPRSTFISGESSPHPNVAMWEPDLTSKPLNGKVWWKWNESMCAHLPLYWLCFFVFCFFFNIAFVIWDLLNDNFHRWFFFISLWFDTERNKVNIILGKCFGCFPLI